MKKKQRTGFLTLIHWLLTLNFTKLVKDLRDNGKRLSFEQPRRDEFPVNNVSLKIFEGNKYGS